LTMVGKLSISSNGSLTNLDGLSGLSKVVSETGPGPVGVLSRAMLYYQRSADFLPCKVLVGAYNH